MKSKRKVAATVFGALVLMLTTGATPAMCPLERQVAASYRGAVAIYDKAQHWGAIARWWIDPEAATRVKAQPAAKSEDVCQARPAVAVR